ncbi:MAG: hypothetical protein WC967_13490 [Balneolaceae bacterium]
MNSLKNKKKRPKSNWMRLFVILPTSKEQREANLVERARIERAIDYKHKMIKQRG